MSSKTKIDIGQLSDWGLARLLLRRLWRIYDASGHSCGRSIRAALLECINNLLDPPEEIACWGDALDQVDTWDIVEEARRRRTLNGELLSSEYQRYLFLELQYLPDWEYACLCLEAILKWYKTELEKKDCFGYRTEIEIAEFAFWLMQAEHYLRQVVESGRLFDPIDLVLNGRDRCRLKNRLERIRELSEPW